MNMKRLVRRAAAIAAVASTLVISACGGGGGGGDDVVAAPPSQGAGQVVKGSLRSVNTGFTYPIDVFLPQSYAAGTSRYPVIYAIEGDAPYGVATGSGSILVAASRFNMFKEAMQKRNTQAILVGIGGTARRDTDFVLPGASQYLNFITKELAPAIESQYRADPQRRALSGLSHGGYFVIAALIIEATNGAPSFSHYLSTETSAGVHPGGIADFLDFERQLDAGGARALPVTLFITGAPGFNLARANAVYDQMAAHQHSGLTLLRAQYATSHVGADLPAFDEALERFFSQ
jgi:hypothetical protein